MLPYEYAPYRSLSIFKLFCKNEGGGGIKAMEGLGEWVVGGGE